jgi:dynein heavy chain
LRGYPKEDQKQEVVDATKLVIETPEFDGELIKKASVAAAGMADWARAIIQFHDALLVVKPRQAQLKEAKEASEAALASLNAAKAKLDEVQKNLLAMVNELKAVREEEANLKKQKEN